MRNSKPTIDTWSRPIRSWGVLGLMLLLAVAHPAEAVYQQIRVPYPAETDREALFFHPDLELMSDDDGALILLSRPELTAALEERGFTVEVLIEDLEAFYAARGERDYGIWHTYAEMLDEMNAIHAEFPHLTTAPLSIGTSIEGRDLWAMKVSDNPDQHEDEPEVLFDGVHHAREIMTLEIPLHFIRYLCENYGQDPVITHIVDHRQVWFVPMVNPDGFVYNEQTYPNGGGMWRKNRRDNEGSSCWGVDPNRNYPYEWGGSGSSGDPCDETYRGTAPGSEPCVAVHMNFINQHEFVTWQSYHSVAGMVLIPWGFTNQHTPDDAVLRAIAYEMASTNGYEVGQPGEILYNVNGGSFDWGYGASNEHPTIYCFSTEVAGSGFWPDPDEREGLIEENLYSNIYLCLVAGGYLDLAAVEVTGGNSNGRLDPGESANLVISVHNPGVLIEMTGVTATLSCDDPYVQLSDAHSQLGDIGPSATVTSAADPFALTVAAACPEGRRANFTFRLSGGREVVIDETVSLTIGQAPVLWSTDFEQAGSDWAQDPTHTAATGAFVRIDPVATQFQPGDDATPGAGIYGWITAQNPTASVGIDDVDDGISATRSPIVDLSAASHVRLELSYFCGQRDHGDDSNDFFSLDVSNDGGASFPANLVAVGDESHGAQWQTLAIDLEELLPLTSQMMLRMQAADAPGQGDIIEAGIDEVYCYDRGDGNQPPGMPGLLAPPAGSVNLPVNPTLTVSNASDPDGDPLTYGFQVFADALLTQPVVEVTGIPEGSGGATSWTVTPALAPNQTYYWRAFAADPSTYGGCMPAADFGVGTSADLSAADSFALQLTAGPNPAQGAVSIRYYTPAAPLARLEIFDVAGRCVRTLAGARWAGGWQEVTWDGCADDGQAVPGGTYWVRLVLPDESRTVRVLQIR